MNELSLFSGAGGGLLGTKLLGFQHIGYVEWNPYCQQIIAQRIKDGIFDEAPIFTDVREFVQSGVAREYRGFTDVVTAGFPCQPFSVAGKRKASDDDRNMWPATMEIIRQVRPANVFLENVSGLLSANETYCQNCGDINWKLCEFKEESKCGTCEIAMDGNATRPFYYFGEILRDLAESGYDARWCVLGAGDLGAIHRRKRLWVYAWDTESESGGISESQFAKHQKQQKSKLRNSSKQVITANSNCIRQGAQSNTSRQGSISSVRNSKEKIKRPEQEVDASDAITRGDKDLDGADTWSQRRERLGEKQIQGKPPLPWGENIRGIEGLRDRPDIPEPLFRGMDDGVANRTHRLTAIGNGQVSSVVATAWNILTNGYENAPAHKRGDK